jgi:uncharacterized protein (TIGR03437 family)
VFTVGAGSGLLYDSDRQINATLPSGLQPGSASLTVTSADDRVSNVRSFTVAP